MKETFDCDICCETRAITFRRRPQKITCLNCGSSCCTQCQYSYGRDDCMNCHITFQQSFIREHLGEKFLKEIVKPKIIRELMVQQEKMLPDVQPLVDWERQIRQQKRDARFGIISYPVERPTLEQGVRSEVFPCPLNGCRGFVKGEPQCATCHQPVCLKCHQPIKGQEGRSKQEGHKAQEEGEQGKTSHVCKVEDLKSVAAVKRETRRCPRCTAPIYKIEGCNDMYCTNCQGHFSWTTGKALATSTNGHYLRLAQYANNVSTLEEGDLQEGCTGEGFSLISDAVEYEQIADLGFPNDLVKSLYEDSNVVRLAKRVRFHQPNILSETTNAYQELQVSYLLKEIDYAHWSNRVYHLHRKQELALMYASILDIYLSTVDSFQRRLHEGDNTKKIKEELTSLVELVNSSFDSIKEEYGGGNLHIRTLTDDRDIPIFTT